MIFEYLKDVGIDPEWMEYLIAKWKQTPLGQTKNFKEKYLVMILKENDLLEKLDKSLPNRIKEQFLEDACAREREMFRMKQYESVVEQYEIKRSFLRHFDDTGERDVSDDTIKELLSFTQKTEELVPSMLRRYRDYYRSLIPRETSVEDDRSRTIEINSADNAYVFDRLMDYRDRTKNTTIELDILLKLFDGEVRNKALNLKDLSDIQKAYGDMIEDRSAKNKKSEEPSNPSRRTTVTEDDEELNTENREESRVDDEPVEETFRTKAAKIDKLASSDINLNLSLNRRDNRIRKETLALPSGTDLTSYLANSAPQIAEIVSESIKGAARSAKGDVLSNAVASVAAMGILDVGSVYSFGKAAVESGSKASNYAKYASTVTTVGKALPLVGAALSIYSDLSRDSKISSLEKSSDSIEKRLDHVIKYLKDTEKVYPEHFDKIITRVNDICVLINTHEDRLYESDRFRYLLKEMINDQLETIYPSEIVEPTEHITTLVNNRGNMEEKVKTLNEMSDEMDRRNEIRREMLERRCQEARRREEERDERIRQYKRESEIRSAEIEREFREREKEREEVERRRQSFVCMWEDVCSFYCKLLLPSFVSSRLLKFGSDFRKMIWGGILFFSLPYVVGFMKFIYFIFGFEKHFNWVYETIYPPRDIVDVQRERIIAYFEKNYIRLDTLYRVVRILFKMLVIIFLVWLVRIVYHFL